MVFFLKIGYGYITICSVNYEDTQNFRKIAPGTLPTRAHIAEDRPVVPFQDVPQDHRLGIR